MQLTKYLSERKLEQTKFAEKQGSTRFTDKILSHQSYGLGDN
jgi:hypothetical protein